MTEYHHFNDEWMLTEGKKLTKLMYLIIILCACVGLFGKYKIKYGTIRFMPRFTRTLLPIQKRMYRYSYHLAASLYPKLTNEIYIMAEWPELLANDYDYKVYWNDIF